MKCTRLTGMSDKLNSQHVPGIQISCDLCKSYVEKRKGFEKFYQTSWF